MTLIRNIGRLFTSTERGVIEDAAVAIDGASFAWVGAERDLSVPPTIDGEEVDAGGGLVTAGLVDAHTHPLYGGARLPEIAARSAGATYAEIASSGGGIAATVAATRASGFDRLRQDLGPRLRRWLETGTTTIEAKTGYHLTRAGEIEALRLLTGFAEDASVPRIAASFLPGHAVSPELAGRRGAYVEEMAGWMVAAAYAGADS